MRIRDRIVLAALAAPLGGGAGLGPTLRQSGDVASLGLGRHVHRPLDDDRFRRRPRRRAVAELTLEKLVLKEAAEGNF